MKMTILLITVFTILEFGATAQTTRYLVQLSDKGSNPFSISNPAAYLSQRAIARRMRYQVPVDSSDLPVTPTYISQIAAIPGVTILNVSKWLNQLAVQVSGNAPVDAINALPFVKNNTRVAARKKNSNIRWTDTGKNQAPVRRSGTRQQKAGGNVFDYGNNAFNEIHLHNGEFLHNIGLRGETMQLALLDGGYFNYTVYSAFDSVNANGQVIDTWDFVAGHASVAEDNSHGMSCFSTIAANIPGQFIGTAPKTGFYLFRTEDVRSEYLIEEYNWVCGAERADSSGADVISSSVGYNTFDAAGMNHSYADLDGNTTMASTGADLAAKKGLLIFIAAGNEGDNAWRYIMTPADADSVVAVGAINVNGVKGAFSSYGPTADGRIKPDIVSVGAPGVIQSSTNTIVSADGTSFACPKIAGLATCLWQAFPEVNNMRIVGALKSASNTFNTPSDSLGYGIPDMKQAFSALLKEFATASLQVEDCNAIIKWTSKDAGTMSYEIERKAPGDTGFINIAKLAPAAGKVLATHSYSFKNSLAGTNAGMISYRVKQVTDTSALSRTAIYIDTLETGFTAGCSINLPNPVAVKIIAAPNPAVQDEIVLWIETPTNIPSLVIRIHDNYGRLVREQKESKNAGRTTFNIPANKLARGKYIITVYDQQKRIGTTELIKL